MGGRLSSHLNAKEHEFITDQVAAIVNDLTPLYKHHYCFHLLNHLRERRTEPTEPRPLIRHPDVATHAGVIIEGTLPQCLDGIWTYRHLQVTGGFAVESRHAKDVFKNGWGCRTELVLSGCHICTSIPEHRALVFNMCRHIAGKSGEKLACWECPTAFPVFIQHPYSSPVCLAAASLEEQTRWTNILRAAARHQSSASWQGDSPESRAFLAAVLCLKEIRGKSQTELQVTGNEEEILVGLAMEETKPYLKESVFPRIAAHSSRRRKAWINLLSEVYSTVKLQVKAAMVALKEELSLYHSDMRRLISADLHRAAQLREHLVRTITEDMFEAMIKSFRIKIIPLIHCTLQEVATPICDGFACTWLHFLEICEDVVDVASSNKSTNDVKKEVQNLLSALGAESSRTWECLNRLELSSERCAWLCDTWKVHSETWRPLLFKTQNALCKVVGTTAKLFWRLLSQYPCFSSQFSQLTAVICRVKDKVLKNLEKELLVLRYELILETVLQITLPAFKEGVNCQDLTWYSAMLSSEQSVYIHPDIIYTSILRNSLAAYIQSEMRYYLPQHFAPLSIPASSPCDSSTEISVLLYPEPPANRHCQQGSSCPSEDPSSKSVTVTPSTPSEREDTLGH